MTIFEINRKSKYMLTVQSNSNRNWFHENTIGGKFAPTTKMYAFGFIGLGRIAFYVSESAKNETK